MNVPITVAIPVGPHPSNTRWLDECLQSIREQTVQPDEVLLIDDGAHLPQWSGLRTWQTPWRSGVAHSFNYGVALAKNELVFMLGSDDRLLPTCLERCWEAWQRIHDPHGYYHVDIQYSDGRPDQSDPCNAAMVHKALWRLTGGFPIEAAIGQCDTMLISIIMASHGRRGQLYRVSDEPLYWYRAHEEIDTLQRRAFWEVIPAVRNLVVAREVG